MKNLFWSKFTLACVASLVWGVYSAAQTVIPPAQRGNTSFVVVVDSATYQHCEPQITQYKQTLEKEGLPTFVAFKNWTSPEEVKEVLKNLYAKEKLEGAVFVGDIPVAMITKAQHLTSAFKMDERVFPLSEVSVPSDRFYDDFDLQFTALKDSTQGIKFFYQLAPASPQYIECDIYSARIRPQVSNGDKYKQVSDFLEKAVRAHQERNSLDQFVSFTGDGSYSNSLVAWRSEQQTMNEQFGDTFMKTRNGKFLRYSMSPYMKEPLIRELRRDDLDMMIFHEHGMPDRQYLTGTPETFETDDHIEQVKSYLRSLVRRSRGEKDPYVRARETATKMGVDSTWYCDALTPEMIEKDSLTDLMTGIILSDVDVINPNARFVIFDACYNGDFREDDFIAGKYIFSKGKCIVTFANSVNVLQDKSAFDLLGLLGYGARLGTWAQHINILESHIHGDPTYRFASTIDMDINALSKNNDNAFWLKQVDAPQADVQNYALIKLFVNNYGGISDLLYKKFMESEYAVVRYNCMTLLERLNDDNYRKVLMVAPSDNFEFIRRIGCSRIGRCGDDMFIPVLVDAYVADRDAARVVFNVMQAIQCFEPTKVLKVIEEKFKGATYYDAATYKAELEAIVNQNAGNKAMQDIKDKENKYRKHYIAYLKNLPYNYIVPQLLELLKDDQQDNMTRVFLAESLAWFNLSVHRQEILDTCKDLLKTGNCSPELALELTRACNRIESKK